MRAGRCLPCVTLLAFLALASAASANAKPVCRDISVTAQAGKPVNIVADCSDPDGEPVHPAIGAGHDVQHGRLSMNSGGDGWTYTSDAGYEGPDSFQYVGMTKFSGATPDDVSAPATVSITVTRPPTKPVSDADGDGVADKYDTCPTVPGSADFNGCPPDSDGDGIPDASDRCPNADAGYEGRSGCPAPWRADLRVASLRAAKAIHRFWRSSSRRAEFRRTLRMPIRVRLPEGLPRGRDFSVNVTFADRPLTGGLLNGRKRCRPGRSCRVVLTTERFKLPGFTAREQRRHRFICTTSMTRPRKWSDGETVPLRF